MFVCCLAVLGSCCCKALAFGALNWVTLCLGIFVGVLDKPVNLGSPTPNNGTRAFVLQLC